MHIELETPGQPQAAAMLAQQHALHAALYEGPLSDPLEVHMEKRL